MSKENVLNKLELLTIEQAVTISLSTVGDEEKRITVLKTVDGEGYQGSLSGLINEFYDLTFQAREWVIKNFFKADVQSVGGQPDCPC